jgi:integrase
MDSKVWIESKNGSLRLRWRFEGKRYCLGLGVRDSPTGRAFADRKKGDIQIDLIAGYFDRSLLKYRPQKLGKNPTDLTAVQLIEKYAADRSSELSPSSIDPLKAIASKLTQLLGDKPASKVTKSVAKDAIARWSETASNGSIKTYLFLLRACWNWGRGKYHMADTNPWSESLDRGKVEALGRFPKGDAPRTRDRA